MRRMNTRFSSKAKICAICLGYIEFQGLLDTCSHEFCYDCILRWSSVRHKQTENKCPLCRERFYLIKRQRNRKEYVKTQAPYLKQVCNKDQGFNIFNEDSFIAMIQQIVRSAPEQRNLN